MLHFRSFGFLVLILVFWQPNISSQTINTKKEKWGFSLSLGYYAGGPSNDLKDFLHASGYSWYLRSKKYLPYEFEINRRIKNRFIIGVSLYSINQSLIRDYLWDDSKFKTILLTPSIGYNFKDLLSVNIGPSLNKISFYHPTGTSLIDDETYLRLGFVLKSTLKIPRKTRMFFQFEVNYSFSGTISPYYHIEIPGHQYHFTTLIADNLPINFFYIGTGLGFRLFQ